LKPDASTAGLCFGPTIQRKNGKTSTGKKDDLGEDALIAKK
jgi:hypothetical protein